MIDTKWIGHRFPVMRWEVEKDRVRFFARAIGETRPEYIDEEAAKAAGYPSLPMPTTSWRYAPQEGAGAVALFCYPESNYITGETVVCDGAIR
jgi:hypothetical protein